MTERELYVRDAFVRHGTDKASHGYARIYAEIPEDIHVLLEIGVDQGASLNAWVDIFPHAKIVGLDLDLHGLVPMMNVTLLECDALTIDPTGFGPFDLIVDDGSHTLDDQYRAVTHWWDVGLKRGGTFIVEDVTRENADMLMERFGKDIRVERTGDGFDDRVLVLRKW